MNDFDLKMRANTEPSPIPAGFEGRLLARLDDLPEAAAKKRGRVLRPALIAAVLVVALVGTALAAGTAGFNFVRFFGGGEPFTGIDGEEYTAGIEFTTEGITYFPVESLSEAYRAMAEASPHTLLDQPSWEAAAEFLGVPLPNSVVLEERGEPAPRKYIFTFPEDGVYEETYQCLVHMEGTALVSVSAGYRMDGAGIQVEASLLTDACPHKEEAEIFSAYYDDRNRDDTSGFTWEGYRTPGGLEAAIFPIAGSGSFYEAVFTLDGIRYSIHTSGSSDTLNTLKEVLDGFQ